MKRVTRAKRAAKSTAVDSPAEDAADNDVECSKSPVIKSKRKSRKEEVVDSDVEEDKEVEEKKSKKKGKKKTSSSKRKSRSSKFHDNHSSEEASAEDVGENAVELKKSKSDKHKQNKNLKQDKQEQEPQDQEVQEKQDEEAKVVERREKKDQQDSQEKKELDKNNQEKKDPEKNSQEKTVKGKKESYRNSRERTASISKEKKVQEKRESDRSSEEKIDPNTDRQEKKSHETIDQDRIDEKINPAKKDDKKGQNHKELKTLEQLISVENVSKQESQIVNTAKLDTPTEETSKEEGHSKHNINIQAQEDPIQDNFIKQSEQITQQDVKPLQDSTQDVLTEKVTESDLEIEKVLEPKQKVSEQNISEQAVQYEDAQKKHVQKKKYSKEEPQERKRRDRKVSDESDKKSTQEQEKSKISSKQISLESPVERENENKISDTNDENTLNKSDVVSPQEESTENGPSTPFVLNRKRKWGSRPAKITTQKSLTISTDVLKDIIPDVKPVEFDEVIEHKKHDEKRRETEKIHKPVLPKIVIDNTIHPDNTKREEGPVHHEPQPLFNRKVSIVKENDIIMKPLSPPRNKSSSILYITNLVRPFTLPQLKNLLQRTGRIVEDGFWIDRIKSKCYVKYETEDQAVETRHALHGVTWPISNPKALQVDFSTEESFDKAKISEENPATPVSTIPGTVEDWLHEQDLKRARDELEKPWQRKAAVREWDVGKGEKEKEHPRREEKPVRRQRTPERRSPEPASAKKFKKKEDEAPAKLLDDLFQKTKTTPCIYWLPLSSETIAVKEEQRRVHMLEHERRMQEIRRQRRH